MQQINKQLQEYDYIFNKYKNNNLSNHAFPLYLFTARLYEKLEKSNCKDILFMSREGQFLKKLFEKYCLLRKEFGLDVININSHYFYGSRNSIMSASVKPLEEENFEFMFRFFNYFIKPSMFLYSIGFSKSQIEDVRKSFGKNIDKICLSFKSSKTFKKLQQNEVFRKIYEENRAKQSVSFAKYMQTFNIDYNNGLVFVDIGYHGTMQDLIFKYFDEKVNIQGYFIKNRGKQTKGNLKYGLLGDNVDKKLFGAKVNKYDAFNYEQILRADHGRCLGYEVINDTAQPLLDIENKDEEVFEKYVKTMQDQILEKFELIARKSLNQNIDIEKICTIYYYNTVKNKSKQDYKWILDMQDNHHDDFGYVGYPGRAFARALRKFAFTLKDKIFVLNNACYIKKLIKTLKDV